MPSVRNRTALTARDRDVLAYVKRHWRRWKCGPTRREIGDELGFSKPTAEGHLRALEQFGLVKLRSERRGVYLTRKA